MSILQRLNPNNIPPGIDPDDDQFILREKILQRILIVLMVIGLAAYFSNVYIPIQRKQWSLVAIYSVALLFVMVVGFIRELPYNLRAYGLLSMIYLLGMSVLLDMGLAGGGRVFLIVFPIMTFIIGNARGGLIASGLSILSLVVVGYCMASGIIPVPSTEAIANSGNFSEWISDSIVFALLLAASGSSLHSLTAGLNRAHQKQTEAAKEFQLVLHVLEARVDERSVQLQRRTAEIEAASDLARKISTTSNLQELLDNAAELIRQHFGFHHTGIFILDDHKEYAVLISATGEAGRQMLARNHRLKVGEIGIVSYVVGKGEPRISSDVDVDPFHFKNPLLPETRSEMALPLKIGEQIIGALDVQNQQVNSFSIDDVKILQTIADQLAVAIDKAILVQKLQSSLQELENTTRETTRRAWAGHIKATRNNYSYRYRSANIEEDVRENPEAEKARDLEKVIITKELHPETHEPFTAVALPIRLRNEVLGVLNIRFAAASIPQDLLDLLEATSDRLALALDNARLLEDIQSRVVRDQSVVNISNKVRSSTGIDGILRVTAQELGLKLGVSEVTVQLRTQE